ncbi:hypothetical protein BJF77_15770 [Kocuria sp. CNJ-770]|nr:hypothetical protein BJF77_15770 [Kocuria sp. CNJ-770]
MSAVSRLQGRQVVVVGRDRVLLVFRVLFYICGEIGADRDDGQALGHGVVEGESGQSPAQSLSGVVVLDDGVEEDPLRAGSVVVVLVVAVPMTVWASRSS